jgi:uncharacterized protein (DUF2141 family)
MSAREIMHRPFLLLLWPFLVCVVGQEAIPLGMAQGSGVSKLTIRVADARNSRGQVAIALFAGADGFPGDKTKALHTLQVPIDPKTMSAEVSVRGLSFGSYAVAVFHDENGNGRLDKNMLGVPKEGYGFSNLAKRSMGPPKFADAEFALDQPEQTIEIKLAY